MGIEFPYDYEQNDISLKSRDRTAYSARTVPARNGANYASANFVPIVPGFWQNIRIFIRGTRGAKNKILN